MNNLQGWLCVYKPLNITSFDVIKKIKKKFNFSKIGHAGTLDPLAEGVLPIALGKTTKLISYVNNDKKEYEFEIKWGEQTLTDDREGKVIAQSPNIPSYFKINEKLKKFNGKILQEPPKASAIKINGQRAYNLLRKNKKFEVEKKIVEIYESKIISFDKKEITKFKIKCGKGFYVRSFARDLAEELDTKGHIFSLKRIKVGKFSINNSILLDDLIKISQRHLEFRVIHPSISMLDDILAYEIDDSDLIHQVAQGKSIKINENFLLNDSLNFKEGKKFFLTHRKNVLSIGKLDGNLFKPLKVLL